MKKLSSVLLLLMLAAMRFLDAKKGVKKDTLRIVKFGNCDEAHLKNPNLSYLENVTVANIGRGMNVVNGKFIHKRNVESIYTLVLTYKCGSRDGDDCTFFASYRFEDFCAMLVQQGQYWTPFWSAFGPRFKCPLRKNIYEVKNATLDAGKIISVFKHIPNLHQFFWMLKANLYSLKQREFFGCMMLMYQHVQIRVRDSD